MLKEKTKVYLYTRVSTATQIVSRFGRNAADVLATLQVMQDFGVNLICAEDGIDSSKDAGRKGVYTKFGQQYAKRDGGPLVPTKSRMIICNQEE